MSLVETVHLAGVVGAGGAGFPTHVKLEADAEWYLANGAECEPLLHKDRELMLNHADAIVDGLQLAAASTGASKLAIGVKAKNSDAVDALQQAVQGTSIEISQFGDFYPSGDEYEVVHQIAQRLIPAGGIPIEIGVVVNNVETLYQIHRAAQGFPVTETFLSVVGLVKKPITLAVPIGMSVQDTLQLAGGPTTEDFAVMDSGLMMGRLVGDLSQPVTKTTAGLIVLPRSHDLIRRYETPPDAMARIGKSACDQCSYCTELCPRYLLGYDVQPHAVMRSLGFNSSGSKIWNEYSLLCCGCGICTLYACPESLFPREACLQGMADLREEGKGAWQGDRKVTVHPMKEYRRVPMDLLMKKLGVAELESEAAMVRPEISPDKVRIPLKQHVGTAARPEVQVGAKVVKGQLIASAPSDQLGASVHSSIDGEVTEVSEVIVIEKG